MQLQDQIAANQALCAALQRTSSSVIGEKQKQELASLQLKEVMKEHYELVTEIHEKSTEV